MRRRSAVFAAVATGFATWVEAREPPIHTGLFSNAALGGYDAVAYFTEGRAVKGDGRFTHRWQAVEWRFASAEHRDRFAADPERYAPRYGGYCAWAVAQGYTASGSPEHWRIVDGRLYLNYDAAVQHQWEQDIPGFIARADRNWPAVLDK
jgi:hypothetical protein